MPPVSDDGPAPRVLVVGDVGDNDSGYVGERLESRGAVLRELDRDNLPDYADAAPADLLLLLGSARSAHATDEAEAVARESALVRESLANGVPVLGICYGSQLLAHALGGTVSASASPEIGFFTLDSEDAILCPPGPWAQMHSDAFEPPSTSRVLGRSSGGCQGFADESRGARALGWQFHPEVTADEFTTWLTSLSGWVAQHGSDAEALRTEAFARADQLREQAYVLTDDALGWLRRGVV